MLIKRTVKDNLRKRLIFKLKVMRDLSLINLEDYYPIREERERKAREIIKAYDKAINALNFSNGNIDNAINYLKKVRENLKEEMKSIFHPKKIRNNPWQNKIKICEEAISILERFKKIARTEIKGKIKQKETKALTFFT